LRAQFFFGNLKQGDPFAEFQKKIRKTGADSMLLVAFICLLIALPGIGRAQSMDGNGPAGDEAIKKEILKHEDEDHEAFMKADTSSIDRLYDADGVSLTYADG
jgi:hypothetical protein